MPERSEIVDSAPDLAEELAGAGVAGVTIAWADNNGIPRSRTVPVGRLAEIAVQGVGITTLFAVFDSHDGHFTGLLGLVTARRGALVVVADSYRSLGHDGVHLQPVERFAAALAGRGVLLAVAPEQRAAAEEAVTAAGLATELWDNGSPDAGLSPPYA